MGEPNPILVELQAIKELLAGPPAVLPLVMHPNDAARFVGLSRSGLYREVSAGNIVAVQLPEGGRVFRRKDLESFVDKLKPARRKVVSA